MAGLRPPLSTLRLRPRERLRMTRGQGGSLLLSCIELSSTTLCQSPGAPCCRHYPGAATGGTASLIRPAMSAFPERVLGSACASTFSRFARRSLALRPAHSHGHQYVTRLPEGFSHFVTSMTAPVASGWSGCRVGLAPTGKRRLFTAHTQCSPWAAKYRAPLEAVIRSRDARRPCEVRCSRQVQVRCRPPAARGLRAHSWLTVRWNSVDPLGGLVR